MFKPGAPLPGCQGGSPGTHPGSRRDPRARRVGEPPKEAPMSRGMMSMLLPRWEISVSSGKGSGARRALTRWWHPRRWTGRQVRGWARSFLPKPFSKVKNRTWLQTESLVCIRPHYVDCLFTCMQMEAAAPPPGDPSARQSMNPTGSIPAAGWATVLPPPPQWSPKMQHQPLVRHRSWC